MTPLEEAFLRSRKEQNIDIVLPVFLNSSLYVAGKKDTGNANGDLYVVRAPGRENLCVTVSESPLSFKDMSGVDILEMGGRTLLSKIKDMQWEIMVMYPSGGGDYLNTEHLSWFKNQYSI